VHVFFFFFPFFFFLSTDAIILMAFTGGLGTAVGQCTCTDLFAFIFFLYFDRIYCDLYKYYRLIVFVFVSIYFIFI
jgi:hypothetical protein